MSCCCEPEAKLAPLGLIAIDCSVALWTMTVVWLWKEPEVQVMVAVPGPTPVTWPEELTLATCALEVDQVVLEVRFRDVPSL